MSDVSFTRWKSTVYLTRWVSIGSFIEPVVRTFAMTPQCSHVSLSNLYRKCPDTSQEMPAKHGPNLAEACHSMTSLSPTCPDESWQPPRDLISYLIISLTVSSDWQPSPRPPTLTEQLTRTRATNCRSIAPAGRFMLNIYSRLVHDQERALWAQVQADFLQDAGVDHVCCAWASSTGHPGQFSGKCCTSCQSSSSSCGWCWFDSTNSSNFVSSTVLNTRGCFTHSCLQHPNMW